MPAAALPLLLLLLVLAASGCGASSADPRDDASSDAASDTAPNDLIVFVGLSDGALLSGRVQVELQLSQRLGAVRGVELYLGEERVDAIVLAPWIGSVDTRAFGDGEHLLRARVARLDDTVVEAAVRVRIDNHGPVVTLRSPADGSALFAAPRMQLELDVDDPSGVSQVAVSVNGLPLATLTQPPWGATFAPSDLALTDADLPIALLVSVSATDQAGQRSLATFSLTLRSRLAFRVRTLGELWAPPVIASDGTAYFGSRDGNVYAVGADGGARWQVSVGAEVVTSPALLGTGDVVVTAGNRVVALARDDGHLLWAYDAGVTVGSGPAVGNGAVYAGTYGNALVALDAASGTVLWQFPAGDAILSTPAIDPLGTVVFGASNGLVYGVDASGTELWRFQTGDAVWSSPRIAADGDILVGSNDGYLYRLNRYGSLQREFEARGEIWGAAAEATDGTVYVASTYRRLYALAPVDGRYKWEVDYLAGFSYATPVVARDGTVYIVSTDGVLHALAPDRTELWSFAAGASAVGAAALAPDGALAWYGASDRHMYAVHTGLDGELGCGAPDMVEVGGHRIMRYEASRADATADQQGSATDRVCSRPGVRPWTGITWQEAQTACARIGLQLCSGTVWAQACQGPGGTDFPYGTQYQPTACVSADYLNSGTCASPGCGVRASGEAAACTSAVGANDMSGNVREWTLDPQPGGYLVRGGSFLNRGDDLRCSNTHPTTHVLAGTTRADDLGFRCCTIP